jgi:hypothetical protein
MIHAGSDIVEYPFSPLGKESTMSNMIEGLEKRTLFSIPPIVAADITVLREQGIALKLDLTDSKKAADADFKSLVLTLKANGVYKADRVLLGTLSRDSARYRGTLVAKTGQLVAQLNSKVTVLVNAIIAVEKHEDTRAYNAFYRVYANAYSRYNTVEDEITNTLESDRDALGSVDVANLDAISESNTGNTSVLDEVDSIISSSNTGESDFAGEVQTEANDAAAPIDYYLD